MARKRARIAAFSLLVVLIVLAVAITFTVGWRPFVGPNARPLTDRKFEATPERLARGTYLVEHVIGCFACHSPHDWSQPGAPVKTGMNGAGRVMSEESDFPGYVIAPNITPDKETGAGNWSDDALARAIREGIGHDGRALFPLMPYTRYRNLSDEDLASIIVYLRSVPAVHNEMPKTTLNFPVSRLIQSVPQPITEPVEAPVLHNDVEKGKYLIELAGCSDCHTPQRRGKPIPGMAYAGGNTFRTPLGKVTSPNITPDASGISYYDEALFLQVLRTGMVKARKLNPAMPWYAAQGATDEDLKAMFAYLRTLNPVKHRVDNSESASICKLCGGTHGAGSQN